MTDALTTAPQDAGPLAAILADPAKLRDMPIDTVERLFALHERSEARRAEQAFSEAALLVRQDMPVVGRSGWNEHTKSAYAKLDDLYRSLVPVATAHGFSWATSGGDNPAAGCIRIVLRLRHTGGHTELHFMDAPIDTTGPGGKRNKTALHGTASTWTYLENKLVVKVFGIQTGQDDDGNAGGGTDAPQLDGPLLPEQVDIIEALLEQTGADREKFLKLAKEATVVDMPQHKFPRAKKWLEGRLP